MSCHLSRRFNLGMQFEYGNRNSNLNRNEQMHNRPVFTINGLGSSNLDLHHVYQLCFYFGLNLSSYVFLSIPISITANKGYWIAARFSNERYDFCVFEAHKHDDLYVYGSANVSQHIHNPLSFCFPHGRRVKSY